MAKVSRTTLYIWFKKYARPAQEQFSDAWDSFWHKDDKLPASSIEGLDERFSEKADEQAFTAHVADTDAHNLPVLLAEKAGKTHSHEIVEVSCLPEYLTGLGNNIEAIDLQKVCDTGARTSTSIVAGQATSYDHLVQLGQVKGFIREVNLQSITAEEGNNATTKTLIAAEAVEDIELIPLGQAKGLIEAIPKPETPTLVQVLQAGNDGTEDMKVKGFDCDKAVFNAIDIKNYLTIFGELRVRQVLAASYKIGTETLFNQVIDFATEGIKKVTLTGSTSFQFANNSQGAACQIYFKNNASSEAIITFPEKVSLPQDSDLKIAAGKEALVSLLVVSAEKVLLSIIKYQ